MPETCSVLMVDDDPGVRTALAAALDCEGFDVRSAANGRDALAVLGRWRPHLILLDLGMPIMDGWAFREELRRRPDLADIPVIVLSAARSDRGHIDELDAVDVISKPCELDGLVAAIRRAIGSVRADALEEFPPLPAQAGAAGRPTPASHRPRRV